MKKTNVTHMTKVKFQLCYSKSTENIEFDISDDEITIGDFQDSEEYKNKRELQFIKWKISTDSIPEIEFVPHSSSTDKLTSW